MKYKFKDVESGIKSIYVEKIRRIDKFIIWAILLFMPLSTYTTPITGITVGDVVIIVVLVIILINIFNNQLNLTKVIAYPIIYFIFFIIFHCSFIWMIKPQEFSLGILSVTRYLTYLLVVALGARYFFKYSYVYKIYVVLAMLFSVYCIAQFISYNLFDFILPTNLFGLPTVDYVEAITSEKTKYLFQSGIFIYRPRSVFLEPAYFAAYQIPILYLILNNNNNNNESILKRNFYTFLITISILLSGTTTGILLLGVCWIKPIFNELRKLSVKIIPILILMASFLVIFLSSSYAEQILNRIISVDGGVGTSVVNRIGNINIIYDGSLTTNQLIYGQGMWTETGYLPSLARIILSFGLMGIIIFSIIMICTYRKTTQRGRSIIILFLIFCVGTNTLFNISSILILYLIYSNYGNIQNTIK